MSSEELPSPVSALRGTLAYVVPIHCHMIIYIGLIPGIAHLHTVTLEWVSPSAYLVSVRNPQVASLTGVEHVRHCHKISRS